MQQLLEQTKAYALLSAEAKENKLRHAYLLAYDDPKLLRETLKVFSKLFFQYTATGEPTPKSVFERICSLIDAETYVDCLFFPDSDKKFSVENASSVAEESTLRPVEGERKLFVIGDFSEATLQAQNKLLKLLEEPPKGVYFLLGATSTYPVLPTILSRTAKLEIPPFSELEIAQYLKRKYPNENNVSLFAAAAGGIVGTAQSMLEGGYYTELSHQAFSLAACSPHELPATVKKIGETKHKKEFLSLLRLIFRDALLLKALENADAYLVLKSEKPRLEGIAERYGEHALLLAQEELSKAEKDVKFNAAFAQCLEIFMSNVYKADGLRP